LSTCFAKPKSLQIKKHYKTCDFNDSFVIQNICRLKVSVNDAILYEFLETFHYLKQNAHCFFLLKPFGFEQVPQIAIEAYFCDEIVCLLGLNKIHKLHDVFMVELFQDFDFLF
jgi:hypothetical protein